MDLYRQQILDHYKNPENFGRLAKPDVVVEETNASCGDEVTLFLQFHPNGTIKKVAWEGRGCAISQAAISILSTELPNLSAKALKSLNLEDIYAMLGGKVNPGRVKCAALGLKAVEKALSIFNTS